jgi:hypothetical protein
MTTIFIFAENIGFKRFGAPARSSLSFPRQPGQGSRMEMIGKPVREWHDVTRQTFQTEIVPMGEPAVLRGLQPSLAAVRAVNWSLI